MFPSDTSSSKWKKKHAQSKEKQILWKYSKEHEEIEIYEINKTQAFKHPNNLLKFMLPKQVVYTI